MSGVEYVVPPFAYDDVEFPDPTPPGLNRGMSRAALCCVECGTWIVAESRGCTIRGVLLATTHDLCRGVEGY